LGAGSGAGFKPSGSWKLEGGEREPQPRSAKSASGRGGTAGIDIEGSHATTAMPNAHMREGGLLTTAAWGIPATLLTK
jgi:hypothetical protein